MLDCFWTIWAGTFKVSGHFDHTEFRKCAVEEANKLGVKGFIQNVGENRLVGEIQAPLCEYNDMKFWLRHRGNQMAIIDGTYFYDERLIASHTYSDFKMLEEQKKVNTNPSKDPNSGDNTPDEDTSS